MIGWLDVFPREKGHKRGYWREWEWELQLEGLDVCIFWIALLIRCVQLVGGGGKTRNEQGWILLALLKRFERMEDRRRGGGCWMSVSTRCFQLAGVFSSVPACLGELISR